mmetsp:Transcript_48604/g.101537  ORF Transcript_48604/g.101537 Transcript_48604/m.101537 type:complete len:89 (+) Transcript_48604:525-791(+)
MMGHVQDVMVCPILGGTNRAVGMGCAVSRSAYVIQIGMEMIVMCFAVRNIVVLDMVCAILKDKGFVCVVLAGQALGPFQKHIAPLKWH